MRKKVPAQPESWLLCVDESGEFTPGSRSMITGLLVQDRDTPALQAAWRKALERIFPLHVFPQHAHEIRQLASRLVGYRRLSPAAREALAPVVQILCDEAWARIGEGSRVLGPGTATLRQFLAQVEAGTEVGRELLVAVGDWLAARDASLAERLRAQEEEEWRQFRSFAETIGGAYGPRRCYLVAAGVQVPSPGGGARGEPDPFITTLAVLLERVVALLRSRESPRLLVTRLDPRYYRSVKAGQDRPVDAEAVAACWGEAARFPLPCGVAHGEREELLRILVSRTSSRRICREKGHQYHPGLVIADLCSNRLFGLLRKNPPLERVLRISDMLLGLPLRAVAAALSDAGELPSLAMAGEPRAAIARAWSVPRLEPAWDELSPRWAREQAQRWYTALAAAQIAPAAAGGRS